MHFLHIDILEPFDSIFAVFKVDVKILVVIILGIRRLFTFSMRTKRTFSPNGSYYLTRGYYGHGIILHKMVPDTVIA